jgi:hypothetical protein
MEGTLEGIGALPENKTKTTSAASFTTHWVLYECDACALYVMGPVAEREKKVWLNGAYPATAGRRASDEWLSAWHSQLGKWGKDVKF